MKIPETNSNATLRRLLALAGRGLWLLMAAASLVVFVADFARLAQVPIAHCDSPESGCTFNSLADTDAHLIEQTGLPVSLVYAAVVGLVAIARLSLPLVGAFIFWQRPDDRVAWVLSLAFMSVLTEGTADLGRLQPVADLTYGFGLLMWLPMPFIFPNGRLEPARLRWLVVAFMVVDGVTWTPKLGAWLLPPEALAWLSLATGLLWCVLAAGSLFYRYHYLANTSERQQTKWAIAGFMAVLFASTSYLAVSALYPPWQPSGARLAALLIDSVVYAAGYAGFAACMAIAILRYRLWDIDVVIRRTLVYTTLTVLLALVYLGAVTLIQQVFHNLTHDAGSLASVVSTLISAALFQPLRRRVQYVIDQRFYRRKYDAAQTLAHFAATARDDVDLDELTAHLHTMIEQTMQPAHSSLWLRRPLSDPVQPPR
ncbi:MAG: hypothetical protein ABI847_17665 [Anaerolineales bacterium]